VIGLFGLTKGEPWDFDWTGGGHEGGGVLRVLRRVLGGGVKVTREGLFFLKFDEGDVLLY